MKKIYPREGGDPKTENGNPKTRKSNKLKKFLLSLMLLEMLFSFTPAFAADAIPDYSQGGKNPVSSQIEKYLCAPTDASKTGEIVSELTGKNVTNPASNPAGSDLYNCVNRIYKFAIIFASVMAMFFIVIGGYVYMSAEGNTESVDKAKSILTSSITALVLLFSVYILLRYINPDIIKFSSFQPYNITYTSINNGEGSGGGKGTNVIIGSSGSEGCIDCVDYTKAPYSLAGNGTQIPGQNTFLTKNLVNKLVILKSKYSSLIINEGFPPTVDHAGVCHFNGTCADIGTRANITQDEINKFCDAAKASGLSVLNEYVGINTTNCGLGTKTSNATGSGHFHVQ